MVLRKQEDLVPRPLSQAVNNPPYPTTPSEERVPQLPALSTDHPNEHSEVYSPDLNKSPAFQLKPLDQVQKRKEDDEDSIYSDNEWDDSDEETPEDLPDPLKIGGGKTIPPTEKKGSLPDVLKVGPPKGMPIKKPVQNVSPEPTGATPSSYASNVSGGSLPLQTNNPYLKIQHTGQSNFGAESSQQVWGDAPAHAQQYAVELPSFQTPDTPTNHMANLSLGSNSPPIVQEGFQTAQQPPKVTVEAASPLVERADQKEPPKQITGNDATSFNAFEQHNGQSAHATPPNNTQPAVSSEDPWKYNATEDTESKSVAAREAKQAQERHTVAGAPQQPDRPAPTIPFPSEEELPPSLPPRPFHEEQPPPQPPRPREEQPPPMPLRPLQTGIIPSADPITVAAPESPNTVMNRQRKETYQIKHIRWHDVNKRGIRTSPILTQNINGPCPLLALVNALVLSTPADMETALIETLRTREQVSLGLLLDAVFDELMSGRRGDAAQELPDVSDLYKFLLALHTGLNVNPMFVQDPEATNGTSTKTTLTARPGVFEDTRDMKLYRTFNLPLMHGWLPDPGSEAYRAFERIAKTYETSQYVQFQEEELNAKLEGGEALSTEEQQMFTDIHAIKEFLSTWPTQLTKYGLKTMRETLQPGQVAILFRNDHFSTLYKDPRTDHLVTLVTDQGYSSHDEIVWESLVDVNGQGSELYSGDFRPVGGAISPQRSRTQPTEQNMLASSNDEGWTTVQRRGNQHTPSSNVASRENAGPTSPDSDPSRVEQEDHDLALALQLQEEEDDRHRRSQEERRRRENALSETAISAQSQQRPSNQRTSRQGETPPVIPPRRNNVQTHRPGNEPAPPPTYEEAATAPTYHPPAGHPANPGAPLPSQGSAYQANNQGPLINQIPPGSGNGRRNSRPGMPHPHPGHPGYSARPGRRHSGVVGPGQEDRDKCVVM
ncbi:hypothetical protein GRF29_161g1559871 [Pseudopithomyces chartarum]|uniref:MINDY deubiquitinase domain-containing protein n=1 Tax=Pseudopithomyces chartarum TaxID=1892770 RepID=A0AAN6LSZ5_9PLEO|nr:hypothetical protein GRF29_161g1559871 [Pseudopithomyces chartarum]